MYQTLFPDILMSENSELSLLPVFEMSEFWSITEVSMNDLYHWHGELMVALEMDDLKREMDSIHLLRDATLSNPGWFERTAIAVGDALVKLGQHLHKEYTTPTRSYQTTNSKYAA